MVKKHRTGALEIRSLTDDGTFSGHGSVFGVKDWYGDVVDPGAFKDSLSAWQAKGKFPKLLLQHDPKNIIGKLTSMREDARGLYVEGKLFLQLGLAKATHTLMKEGELDGLSIGFSVPADGMAYDKVEGTTHLKAIDLWEVSVVTFPANEAAEVEAVKAALLKNPREFERQLRDVLGLSQSEAKKFMAEGYKAVAPRDVSESDRESQSMQSEAQALARSIALWATTLR